MTTTKESERYLDAVRAELADLPEEERAELLEDLAQHLADIAADESRSDVPLAELLGAPADYATELRTAAGLPSKRRSRSARVTRPDLRTWLNNSSLGRWLNGPTGQRFIEPGRALARDLQPAWWVARAGIAVVGFFVLTSPFGWRQIPVPRVMGSRLVGLILIGLAIALSVRLGRRGYSGRKRLVLAADVLIALVALSLVGDASLRLGASNSPRLVYVDRPSGDILASTHGPVTNIYPYDSEGRPLEGVLLYDQDGRPLRVARQEWWADGCDRKPAHPLAADGVPVEFSYPLNYTVSLDAFAPASESQLEQYREMFAERCKAQIPRPIVPIPTFPATATTTTAPAEGTTPDSQP